MDIFEQRYFNFNRKLFVYMGLWPFESSSRNFRKYLLLCVLFIFIMPALISVKVNFSDIDRVLLNLMIFFITLLMFFKVLAMSVAEHKMKALYRNIADNWLTITDDQEKQILVEYSEIGRKKSIYLFAFMQIGGASVFALPTIPKILDIISPLPNPRPRIHVLENELLVDRETYYWFYFVWDFISIIVCASVSVSVDTMFIVCAEHCCALYAIIRYRLHHLKPKVSDKFTKIDDVYEYTIGIIKLHQNSLTFTETVNEAFSLLFLYILTANMACIPISAVTVITTLDKPLNCIRFGSMFLMLGFHLLMLFWPGQNILDHGAELIDHAYCNQWYDTSLRTRKMIVIFMIRCTQPALLAAGGLMLMNFETFSMVVRTAISYITVVASFR